MSDNEQIKLEIDEAIAMLPDGEFVHTFRGGIGFLVGASHEREHVIEDIKEFGAELSGEIATGMNHGMVLKDKHGHLFIETRQGENDESN